MSKKDDIEVLGELQRRSPFDIKNFGVDKDASKERRWVDPNRIDERKNGDGYQFVRPKDGRGPRADDTIRTKGGMVLMERPQEVADARARQKELITRSKTQSAKESLRKRVEEMSSRSGQNLHKYVDEIDREE